MLKRWGRVPLYLLCVSMLFVLFTRTHKFLTVSGFSMVPTLDDRDICIVANFIEPQRGEIYVVEEPDAEPLAIKRLIGVPGDTVELRDCLTFVNGVEMELDITGTWESMVFHLGADEYLFIGDNREASYDGRYWSRPVTRAEILYRVDTRIYPLSEFGRLG